MTTANGPNPEQSWRQLAIVGVGLVVVGGIVAKACSPERGEPSTDVVAITSAQVDAAASAPSAVTSAAPAGTSDSQAAASAAAHSGRQLTLDPNWKPPTPPRDEWGDKKKWQGTLEEQNAHLLQQLTEVHGIDAEQRAKLLAIFKESERIGQGNPAVTRHPVSPNECRQKLAEEKRQYQTQDAEVICGGRYMAPLYDPDKERPEDAKTCIDMFEFPNIPCSYPVTWARANEAVSVCEAMGKRICDAHEWEGACYGAMTPPDYNFGIPKRMKWDEAVKRMRTQHNINVHDARKLAYGKTYKRGFCATGSKKSDSCGLGWRRCGSNTYPAGHFPACTSRLGVYDIHGNAAEHMNLPLAPEQMSSAKHSSYGRTEMKGSWFIFDRVHAHEDHCRWRAPHWHGTRVTNKNSHRNYHLGFRCCKSIE